MRKLVLNSDKNCGLRPRSFEALASFAGPIFNERHSLPHPLGILGHSWGDVTAAFERCLDALQTKRRSPGEREANHQLTNQITAAFRDVLYRSMEFFENLTDNVALTLSPSRRDLFKLTGPKRLRDIVALPCNKLKHNHNRIHYVEAASVGYTVPGFSIYHVVDGALQPNPLIHRERPAKSFNVELRRIIAAIYLYDNEVADSISSNTRVSPSSTSVIDQRTIAVLQRIIDLPLFAMPFENERHMPSIAFDGKLLTIEEHGGLIFPAPADCRMMAEYIGDGVTTSFKVP